MAEVVRRRKRSIIRSRDSLTASIGSLTSAICIGIRWIIGERMTIKLLVNRYLACCWGVTLSVSSSSTSSSSRTKSFNDHGHGPAPVKAFHDVWLPVIFTFFWFIDYYYCFFFPLSGWSRSGGRDQDSLALLVWSPFIDCSWFKTNDFHFNLMNLLNWMTKMNELM